VPAIAGNSLHLATATNLVLTRKASFAAEKRGVFGSGDYPVGKQGVNGRPVPSSNRFQINRRTQSP